MEHKNIHNMSILRSVFVYATYHKSIRRNIVLEYDMGERVREREAELERETS